MGKFTEQSVQINMDLQNIQFRQNNNETSYTFNFKKVAKFTGDTADIEITLSADSVITHINGEATEDGKIDPYAYIKSRCTVVRE